MVSDDGCTVELWLIDSALDRQPYKRRFKFTFIDELSCEKFFASYTSRLPDDAKVGKSFIELKEGPIDTTQESGSETTLGEDNDDDDNKNEDSRSETYPSADDDAESATEEEVDELKRLLEMEEVWGDSQNLFNPCHPYDC